MIRLKHDLILASASPRRRELLTEAGYAFTVEPAQVSEPQLPNGKALSAAVWAEALAYFKARAVAQYHPDALVLGADTVVSFENKIIGKAADIDDARRILTNLFGGSNDIITGIALLVPRSESRVIAHVSTRLTMKPMSSAEVEAYLATGAWQDKAGAYAIQEGGDQFVESIDGSLSNVVGLPMEKIGEILEPYRD